jgi:fatty acid desaturase
MICRAIADRRILFALAGTMTALSVVLAVLVSPWFLVLALFVAANQWLFATVGACPASLVLDRTRCSGRGSA